MRVSAGSAFMNRTETRQKKRTRQPATARLYRQLRQLGKEIYGRATYDEASRGSILFIVGCQRSGTALLTRMFDLDWNAKIYREKSKLSSDDLPKRLRLNSLPKVEAALNRDKASLIVLKPLVESQNVIQLLDHFDGSKAVWIFRNFRAVAASHVKKWGNYNSIDDLQAIVEDRPNNWRNEFVSEKTRHLVAQHYSPTMNPHDASALYWLVRNRFYFQLGLDQRNDVLLCRYEDLVTDACTVMREVYAFVNREFPGDHIVNEVHSQSIRNGARIDISSEVEELCVGLQNDLEQALQRQELAGPDHQA